MPRTRNWRYRDTFNLQEQGDDKSPVEPLHREPTQAEAEPQPRPAENKSLPQRSALARQASQYVSEDTDEEDEEDERFIETGVHIDEYDDRDLEGVEKLRLDRDDSESPDEEPITMRDFMRLLRKDGGVLVSWRLREIVNTGDAAIVLGQIMYWFDSSRGTGKTRSVIRRRGGLWIFKTHAELGRETGIKPRQVRDCLRFLTAKGLIERTYHRANGLQTTYVGLNPGQVHKAMWQMEQERRKNAGATWLRAFLPRPDNFGVVFHSRFEQGGGLVLHNHLIDVDVPGSRLLWINERGQQLVVEPLHVVLDSLDNAVPGGRGWTPEPGPAPEVESRRGRKAKTQVETKAEAETETAGQNAVCA